MYDRVNNEPVKLFWTGGWDSTFALLEHVLESKLTVQPVYLIDENRNSTMAEFLAMKEIKDMLFYEFPYTQQILLPTKYFSISDIPPIQEITNAYSRLLKKKYMGSQYEWLSKFCEWQNINEIELCIHLDDKAHDVVNGHTIQMNIDSRTTYKIKPDYINTDIFKLFHYFSFPLLKHSKVEMKQISKKEGWTSFMSKTWFCHNPTKNLKPCGKCKPCQYTIEEGMGDRIPITRRAIGKFYSLMTNIKK